MIALHKHTRSVAVTLLLIGFLFSNPVMGLCLPMLSDFMDVVHSEMTSGCCDSKNETPDQSHDAGIATSSHGCNCCGCGLQSDETTQPNEQQTQAVLSTQVVEVISAWKTISTVTVAEILPETALWDVYSSKSATLDWISKTDLHSPPLFILHQVLLN